MLSLDCPALQGNRSDKNLQCKVPIKAFHGYTSLPETLNRNFVCYEIRLYENTCSGPNALYVWKVEEKFIIHCKYIYHVNICKQCHHNTIW